MKVAWTRARIALVASAAVSGLAMLYVGVFQIGWVDRLACPAFGSGCESVALARFSWPFGLADGLLGAAFCGIVCALAQVPRRNATVALVALAAVWLVLNAVGVAQMARLGAFCFWCTLAAALAVPVLALSVRVSRELPEPAQGS
jgi:uncharacterized membrane protein